MNDTQTKTRHVGDPDLAKLATLNDDYDVPLRILALWWEVSKSTMSTWVSKGRTIRARIK